MILQDVWKLELDFSPEKSIELEPVKEHLSTDTGLLLFRQLDEQLGFTAGFAAQLRRFAIRSHAFGFGNGAQSRVRHHRRL